MPYRGEMAALTAVILWSYTAILFDTIGKRVGAFNTNLIRLLLASLLLCCTYLMTTGHIFPVHTSQEQQIWLGLSGIIGLAIGDAALFESLVILGPRMAILMLSLAPVFTTILAWIFLGEKLSLLAVAGIVLTVWGIFWVVNEKHHEKVHGSKTRGIIMGVIAALGQGVGVILAKYGFRTEIDTLAASILRMVPATMAMWLAALFMHRLSSLRTFSADKLAVKYILLASFIGPFLGVWLANAAVKYTEAGIAATLLAMVPIFIIPMIWIVRGTTPSVRAVTGTSLAIAGVAMIFLR